MQVIGFRDGFRGLMENRTVRMDNSMLSGILTLGGTILGTIRDKPHKMPMGGKLVDMTDVIVENYHKTTLMPWFVWGVPGSGRDQPAEVIPVSSPGRSN
jgi:6-phosphofructokinase